MRNQIKILSILVLIILGCSTNKKIVRDETSNKSSKFSENTLAKIYYRSLKGSYEYMFSDQSDKIQIENEYYGEYYAGLKGLILYSNLRGAITNYLKEEQGKNDLILSNNFYDLMTFEYFADEIPIFLSGEKKFNSNGIWRNGRQDFQHYNPEIIVWAAKNLIPSPETKIGDISAKKVYNIVFSKFIRMMVESYNYLQNNEYEKECNAYRNNFGLKSFDGLEYLNNKYSGILPAYDKSENFTAMTSSMAIGFWLRRKIDNSNEELWNGLTKIMIAYDNEWFTKNINQKLNNKNN